jgi:hypothetical protein
MTFNIKNSTAAMRMACAIVFVVFTFLFVYDYQTDLIAYTQHVLSRGATTYNRIVGAMVITLALTLLSVGVRAVLKLRARFHALVYFPSLLLLALLAGGQTDGAGDLSFGFWMWTFTHVAIETVGREHGQPHGVSVGLQGSAAAGDRFLKHALAERPHAREGHRPQTGEHSVGGSYPRTGIKGLLMVTFGQQSFGTQLFVEHIIVVAYAHHKSKLQEQ